MADVVEIIQATLAPIFLVSGATIFLTFTQARLFRVVDRLRAIGKDLAHAHAPEWRSDLLQQRARNVRRAILLRNAILFGTLVIAFTILTALLLMASGIGIDAGRWPIFCFAAGLVNFALALLLVVSDAFISVATVRDISREFAEGLKPDER